MQSEGVEEVTSRGWTDYYDTFLRLIQTGEGSCGREGRD